MVKRTGNTLFLMAMVSSVALLLALQVVWLSMEYDNESNRFHREAHLLLRNTIHELNDSIFQKRVWEGSLVHDTAIQLSDNHLAELFADSSGVKKVFITSPQHLPDKGEPFESGFIHMRLKYDSLPIPQIEKRYFHQLTMAGIERPLSIIEIHDSKTGNSQVVESSEIVSTSNGIFQLDFGNLNVIIIKKMWPQIAFSFFLTLLVIGTFILVYRNLLLQQRLVAIKDGLISNISHELKTPITTVGVALEGIKNFRGKENDHVQQEYLEIAEKELTRLTVLTDKVLNTSLDETGQSSIEIKPIDMKKLANEALKSFQILAEKKNTKIEIRVEGNNFMVQGDPDHLSNVLFNLLDNALKYSLPPAHIAIHLLEAPHEIICTVSDKGIGIPKEFQTRVFDKFFRVPTGDMHPAKGYGLGLNYVKSMITRHNGKIEFQSEPGKGSSFSIRLPKVNA
jgi:two-component system, OmpR family, phosphate regulon sensor histidine kinase PhoR